MILDKYYLVTNDVNDFLASNDDLVDILLDAKKHISSIFGNVPVYLEVHSDPEIDWDELFIVIKTNYDPLKAVNLENKLFEEYFVNVLDKVNERLNFVEEPL